MMLSSIYHGVTTHDKTIYWHFDNEFWTDELHDYTYMIEDQCRAVMIR